MSHPLRVRILAMLQERKASPVELAEWLGARLGTVAYHVRTLHELGLIELVDETRVRGAVAHHYRAKERPRVSNEAWDRAAPIAKQAAVGAALQTIDEYARASAAAGGFDRGDAHLSRLVMRLDAQGWRGLSQTPPGPPDRLQDPRRRPGPHRAHRGRGGRARQGRSARGGHQRRRHRDHAVRRAEAHRPA